MPDPNAIGIIMYHCDDRVTMEKLCALLLRKDEWFDVRLQVKHKYSITFNAIFEIPKAIKARLIEIEPARQRSDASAAKSLDTYKADRRKAMKGKRR